MFAFLRFCRGAAMQITWFVAEVKGHATRIVVPEKGKPLTV
jgi:hypothetical protein